MRKAMKGDPMNRRSPLSTAGKLTVAALLVAAAGIVIQIVSGVDFPTVPPGLIILLVAAGLVAFGPWRWTPVVGAVLGIWLLVGFSLSGEAGRLLDPSQLGGFVGLWVQFLAVLVAVVAGIIATIQNYRTGSRTGP
jgi:prepilin signal peptidase PulO-like enzyme (type II secretory pathway)